MSQAIDELNDIFNPPVPPGMAELRERGPVFGTKPDKAKRKGRVEKAQTLIRTEKPPMLCDWCNKPYSANIVDNCKCGIKMPWLKPEK